MPSRRFADKITGAMVETMDSQIGRVVDALTSRTMMDNIIIGFSSDNGGPLDHANNLPFRGGKHTYWEGGVRTEAFIWSPLLPAARRGTVFDGIFHVCDWQEPHPRAVSCACNSVVDRECVVPFRWATYAATAGVAIPTDTGPRPPDSINQWPALLDSAAAPARTEVIHMVHNEKYYPGNCSISCFSSRNCPAGLRVHEMKLFLGYVGDHRIKPLVGATGLSENATAAPVQWGLSGGSCGSNGTGGTKSDDPKRCTSTKFTGGARPTLHGLCVDGCLFK